jgi:hypothetical protein
VRVAPPLQPDATPWAMQLEQMADRIGPVFLFRAAPAGVRRFARTPQSGRA